MAALDELKRLFEERLKNGELKIAAETKLPPPASVAHRRGRALPVSRQNARRGREPEPPQRPNIVTLTNAIKVWAESSTKAGSARYADVVRDKRRTVREFFYFLNLEVDLMDVQSVDVSNWQAWLRDVRGLAATTIYNYCSHLSSFYKWILATPELARFLPHGNPVLPAFPKFPTPYQSAQTRSLSDESLKRLWRVMEKARRSGSLAGRRDYVIFLFFAATGDRRAEILNLRGSDIELCADGLIYYPRRKGGIRAGRKIQDATVARALVDYLKASGREPEKVIGRNVPLWLAHYRKLLDGRRKRKKKGNKLVRGSARSDVGLTGHAFALRMKEYARRAGMFNFHLHQIRHTFARLVFQQTKNLSAAQDALGHKNLRTTQIYVPNVTIRANDYSSLLKQRSKGKG